MSHIRTLFALFLLPMLMGLFSTLAQANSLNSWEASIELHPLSAPPGTENTSKSPTAKIDLTDLVPKQSVIMTVKVWMPKGINWYPKYPDWDMPGATIIPLTTLTPTIYRTVDGESQMGARLNYIVTPMTDGQFELQPQTFKLYPEKADSPSVGIKPITVSAHLPEGADLTSFFPASQLSLSQSFYLIDDKNNRTALDEKGLKKLTLQPRQLLEREITISAYGIAAKQIPALDAPPLSDRQIELSNIDNYGDFGGGTRVEHWFYSVNDAQENQSQLSLQPITLKWWNLTQKSFQQSSLTGVKIKISAPKSVQQQGQISLSWLEKIQLWLSQSWTLKQWLMLGGSVLALCVIVFMRQSLVAFCQQRKQAWQQYQHREAYHWYKLCRHLLMTGLSKGAWKQFQRWRVAANADYDQLPTAQRWLELKYQPNTGGNSQSNHKAKGVSACVLIKEISMWRRVQRKSQAMNNRTLKNSGDKYDLPPLK